MESFRRSDVGGVIDGDGEGDRLPEVSEVGPFFLHVYDAVETRSGELDVHPVESELPTFRTPDSL